MPFFLTVSLLIFSAGSIAGEFSDAVSRGTLPWWVIMILILFGFFIGIFWMFLSFRGSIRRPKK